MKILLEVDPTNDNEVRHGLMVLNALLGDESPVAVQSPLISAYPTQAPPPSLGGALSGQFVTGLQTVPKASVFNEEDVANATRQLGRLSLPAATELLKAFSIERARDLPVEQREAYVTEAKHQATLLKKAQDEQAA